MSAAFKQPRHPLIIYTDLDGTLLDHDTYSFKPALPALRRLRSLDIPVVPVTSKTLAELDTLVAKLELSGPCIAENGGLIGYPPEYAEDGANLARMGSFRVEKLSVDYSGILASLKRLRDSHRFRFTGFSDLTAAEVADLTGLSEHDAVLARRRLCSEPVLWQDSEQAFQHFTAELKALKLYCIKGGRFWHVMGQTDKALAIHRLNRFYQLNGLPAFTTIAMGDSPNDRQMLEAADIAVVIRGKDGSHLTLSDETTAVHTSASGPEGWNEFVTAYLDKIETAQTGEVITTPLLRRGTK